VGGVWGGGEGSVKQIMSNLASEGGFNIGHGDPYQHTYLILETGEIHRIDYTVGRVAPWTMKHSYNRK
jgi:hypothetical protein